MAKTAILVPYQDMCEMTRSIAEEFTHLSVMCVEYNRTEHIRTRVRELEEQGCEIIVARGVHARIAREHTKIPVIELRVTFQELGLIILELKRELDNDRPKIGIIAFANMLRDIEHFNDLFDVELKKYMVYDSGELAGAVSDAVRDGCVAVIGGETVCRAAVVANVPCKFLRTGSECVRDALETASRVGYAIDLEKRNHAEMDTMLNFTPTGIMQVSRGGIVQRVNRFVCNLFERNEAEIINHDLSEFLPRIDPNILHNVLVDGKEAYYMAMDIRETSALANIVPIFVGDEITGALFTFEESRRIIEMDSKLRLELNRLGYVATHKFEQLICESEEMKRCVDLAKRSANYSEPILLSGERSCGKQILAECIHNGSWRKKGAFVTVDCSAWQAGTIDSMLFGGYTSREDRPASIAELANNGTLYLGRIEELHMDTQYKVLNLIQGRFLHNGNNPPKNVNVRVVASTEVNLAAKVESGEFRSDLYYALGIFCIDVPPLRKRREDLDSLVHGYITQWEDKYNHRVRLTPGARKLLAEYDWPGNLEQMSNLCERAVLLTEKRNVDEAFLRAQLERLSPRLMTGTETVVVFKDQKAVKIAELLKKHNGNREKVADELGVSKTTLWRYIKKYSIEQDYTF